MCFLYAFIAMLVFGALFAAYAFHTAEYADDNEYAIRGPGLSAVEFPEQNLVVAKDQPQYRPLPALVDFDKPQGEIVTCWNLTFKQRLKILFTGKLWCSIWTFCNPLQPLYFSVHKSDVVLPKAKPE